jgi:hypothetical protein
VSLMLELMMTLVLQTVPKGCPSRGGMRGGSPWSHGRCASTRLLNLKLLFFNSRGQSKNKLI